MVEVIIDGRRIVDMKVTELREALGERGLPKAGKKHDLIERLYENIRASQTTAPETVVVTRGQVYCKPFA